MKREEFDEVFESGIIRMQKAGWLSPALPQDRGDTLPFTEKGARRQRELLQAFRELETG